VSALLDMAALMTGEGNEIEPAELTIGWKRSR
jgi:hypothetical protein